MNAAADRWARAQALARGLADELEPNGGLSYDDAFAAGDLVMAELRVELSRRGLALCDDGAGLWVVARDLAD